MITLDSRAVPGLGRRTLDEIYRKLGQVEIDDMAAGVKSLWNRPYFDNTRVGIYGTSYGGYAAVMALLRHPDVFAAASASSPVTAWHHYDTIYTERYMWHAAGEQGGIRRRQRDDVRRKSPRATDVLLRHRRQQRASVEYDAAHRRAAAGGQELRLQVGPDRGHSGINAERMMEFFIENLVVHPASATLQ